MLIDVICNIQASQDKKSLDVGANLFVGNLDPVSTSSSLERKVLPAGLVTCCDILEEVLLFIMFLEPPVLAFLEPRGSVILKPLVPLFIMTACVSKSLIFLLLGVLQDVDEKLLYDTFSAFGVIVTNPKVILRGFCSGCFRLENAKCMIMP